MDCVNRDMRAIGTTNDESYDRMAGGELGLPRLTSQLTLSGQKKKKKFVLYIWALRCR